MQSQKYGPNKSSLRAEIRNQRESAGNIIECDEDAGSPWRESQDRKSVKERLAWEVCQLRHELFGWLLQQYWMSPLVACLKCHISGEDVAAPDS